MRTRLSIAAACFLINCIILIWAILYGASGKIMYIKISQFAILLTFQVLNSIFFLMIIESVLQYTNNYSFSRRWNRDRIDEINEHFVRQIIAKMIQEEIKPESLNDLKSLEVKALIHKVKRNRKLDDLDASKNRELMD